MTTMDSWLVFLPPLVSLAAGFWVFPYILRIAKLHDLTDVPDARKLQLRPVPVLGGVTVFFGFVVGVFSAVALGFPGLGGVLPVLLGSSLVLYVGMIDDMLKLDFRVRLLLEALALLGLIYGSGMCVDSLHGLWGVGDFSWWVGVPFTVFGCVGIINAYNMVDGVNGLSGGLCVFCSLLFGAFFWKAGETGDALLAFCFAAALVPFLLHNVFGKRSRMFVGDGGTLVMGLLVSWFVIRVMNHESVVPGLPGAGRGLCYVAMLLSMAAVPVTDTLRVMLGRLLRGVSPFRADKTHLHHAFIRLGVSHSVTSLVEILINAFVFWLWYISYKAGAPIDLQFWLTVVVCLLLVAAPYPVLGWIERRRPAAWQRLGRLAARTHFGQSAWWLRLQAWLDSGEED